MADVTEITLGARKFGIRPLTLRQLRDVEAISVSGLKRRQLDRMRAAAAQAALESAVGDATDPAAATAAAARAVAAQVPDDGGDEDAEAFTRRESGRMVRTIAAALSRDFPEVTEDAINDMEVGTRDLIAPYIAILQLSGLVPAGEAARNP